MALTTSTTGSTAPNAQPQGAPTMQPTASAATATAVSPDPTMITTPINTTTAPRPEEGAIPNKKDRGNIRDLLHKAPIPMAMSEGATKYIEGLKKYYAEHQNIEYRNIRVNALAQLPGVFMVEYNDRVAPLIMHEMVGSMIADNSPDTVVMRQAAQVYAQYVRGNIEARFTLLPAVVIHPSDYHKVEIMGSILSNTLSNISGQESINSAVLKNEPLIISINQSEVMPFIDRLSPHGIPGRHDIGFKLSLAPQNMNYQSRNEMFGNWKNEIEDIAAVTAYTEIITGPIDPMTGIPKFVPVVHITDVLSRIQDIRMYVILVSLAAEIFIRQGLWEHQFARFNKDEPNLGYLVNDPNTKDLMFIDSAPALKSFIYTYMTPPVLVVDTLDGRSRIPDTELTVLSASADLNAYKRQVLTNCFKELCTTLSLDQANALVPFQPYSYENTGLASIGGSLTDTREIDYLRLATNWKSEVGTAALLMQRAAGAKPSDRFDLQKRFYSDAVALYNNNIIRVDLSSIAAIQSEISRNITLDRTSWSPSMANIDLTGAIDDTRKFLSGAGSLGVNGGAFVNMSTMSIYGGPGYYGR